MKIKSFFISALSLYLALFLLNDATVFAKQKKLSVAVLVINKQQIELFSEHFSRFNDSQSEITVNVDFFSDQSHEGESDRNDPIASEPTFETFPVSGGSGEESGFSSPGSNGPSTASSDCIAGAQ